MIEVVIHALGNFKALYVYQLFDEGPLRLQGYSRLVELIQHFQQWLYLFSAPF